MRTIKESLKIVIVSLFMLFLIGVAYAWTEPGLAPPTPNVSAPITTNADYQTKGGWLRIAGTGNGADPATRIGVYDTNNGGGVTGWWLSQNQNGTFAIHRDGVGDKFIIDGNGNVLITGNANICKKVAYGQTGSVGCGLNYYTVGVMDPTGNMGSPAAPPTDGFLLCCKNAD